MARFQHPVLSEGTVHQGDDTFEVKGGVVECSVETGQAQGWRLIDAGDSPATKVAPEVSQTESTETADAAETAGDDTPGDVVEDEPEKPKKKKKS